MFQKFWQCLTSSKGQKTVSKKRSETKSKNHRPQMELFPIGTLMEEMKPTFRERYLFDSGGKSIIVSTLGLLWLPAVWYQDQNDEFQSHNLLENCGQFQTGAEGKIWWLRLQSGIFSIWNCIKCQNTFAEFETVSVLVRGSTIRILEGFHLQQCEIFRSRPCLKKSNL